MVLDYWTDHQMVVNLVMQVEGDQYLVLMVEMERLVVCQEMCQEVTAMEV